MGIREYRCKYCKVVYEGPVIVCPNCGEDNTSRPYDVYCKVKRGRRQKNARGGLASPEIWQRWVSRNG